MLTFVKVHKVENVNRGKYVVKKRQNLFNVVFERPLSKLKERALTGTNVIRFQLCQVSNKKKSKKTTTETNKEQLLNR